MLHRINSTWILIQNDNIKFNPFLKNDRENIFYVLGWKIEKSQDNGDTVQVKTINKKKVFKLTVNILFICLIRKIVYFYEGFWNSFLFKPVFLKKKLDV